MALIGRAQHGQRSKCVAECELGSARRSANRATASASLRTIDAANARGMVVAGSRRKGGGRATIEGVFRACAPIGGLNEALGLPTIYTANAA